MKRARELALKDQRTCRWRGKSEKNNGDTSRKYFRDYEVLNQHFLATLASNHNSYAQATTGSQKSPLPCLKMEVRSTSQDVPIKIQKALKYLAQCPAHNHFSH